MSEKVYRTAIYARLSKEDGDKGESNSIGSQKSMCGEYIGRHPELELVETYVDDGYSGVDFERPGFMAMEKAMREGRINALVCKDFSRISRNYIDGGRYLERVFPQMGIRVIAINDGYDSLDEGCQSDNITIPFKNLINDSYCKDISVKIRSSLDNKRRKGDYVGPFVPYGYMKDPDDRSQLVVDEEAAGVVREIFSLYKGGMGILSIAARLDEMGIPSPKVHKAASGSNYRTPFGSCATPKWSYNAVRRILSNEMYIGTLVQGKRGTPNYKVHSVEVRDRDDWVRVEDSHKPIITYDDFQAVQTMLGRDTRMSPEGPGENIFSGFLFCKDCGQPMVRKKIPSGRKTYMYYVCSANKAHRGCSPHSISEGVLRRAVTDVVRHQVSDVVDLSKTIEYINSLPRSDNYDYSDRITRLEEEIEDLKRKKLGLYESFTGGVIDRAEYADFRNMYNDAIKEKDAIAARIRRDLKEGCLNGDAEKVWVTLFKEHEGIGELDRRVLMALVDKIFIGRDKDITIRFRYADEYRAALGYVARNGKAADAEEACRAV